MWLGQKSKVQVKNHYMYTKICKNNKIGPPEPADRLEVHKVIDRQCYLLPMHRQLTGKWEQMKS